MMFAQEDWVVAVVQALPDKVLMVLVVMVVKLLVGVVVLVVLAVLLWMVAKVDKEMETILRF